MKRSTANLSIQYGFDRQYFNERFRSIQNGSVKVGTPFTYRSLLCWRMSQQHWRYWMKVDLEVTEHPKSLLYFYRSLDVVKNKMDGDVLSNFYFWQTGKYIFNIPFHILVVFIWSAKLHGIIFMWNYMWINFVNECVCFKSHSSRDNCE